MWLRCLEAELRKNLWGAFQRQSPRNGLVGSAYVSKFYENTPTEGYDPHRGSRGVVDGKGRRGGGSAGLKHRYEQRIRWRPEV